MLDISKWEAFLYSVVVICITTAFVLTDGCDRKSKTCDCSTTTEGK